MAVLVVELDSVEVLVLEVVGLVEGLVVVVMED